jgi:hypothetical protein
MSFLTTRAAFTTRRALATTAPRAFSTTIVAKKTATETVKDTLKTVDRAVSDKIVGGIELGGRCLSLIFKNPSRVQADCFPRSNLVILESPVTSKGRADTY